jgi:large subunit ribosomal protein L10
MENPRPEKVAVVEEVRAKLEAADAAVLTEYRGLNVSATSELRRALRAAGGEFKIYKNTLARFAARDLGLELDDLLTGPTAIAFVQGDPVNVAKALRDFAKTNPTLVVKGGVLGTKPLTADEAKALAEVEPREVLLAKLAGAIAAPMVQFAGLLEALPRNFAYGLKALIDQQGGVPETPADEPADAPDAAAPEAPVADGAPAETDAPAEDAPAPEEAAAEAAPAEEPAAEATTDDTAAADEAPTEEPAAADTTTEE